MSQKEQGDRIFVTSPSLPNLEEFMNSLKKIWDSKWLTNNGSFHQELEEQLAEYLGVKYLSLFSNGTLALMTAIQALELKGEVITTPFSFVATSHALWWNKIKPVFADVDPKTGNLDPNSVEKLINAETTGILPVHVYGVPCDVEAFKELGEKHNLKILYDAAHAFAVNHQNGRSVLLDGDLSILSFHATKIYNTIEGGAIISHSAEQKEKIDRLKNFGFVNETTVLYPGINAKMNELQSAYGVLQLKTIDRTINASKEIARRYTHFLTTIDGINPLIDIENEGLVLNYSYYPIRVCESFPLTRDQLFQKFIDNNIISRRYFYPLITEFEPYSELPSAGIKNLPIAHNIASEVICLPIYESLTEVEQQRVMQVIAQSV